MHKLKNFRIEMGLSQPKIARELDISTSMYEKVERGETSPSRNFMVKLKKRYPEINIDEMFFSNLNATKVGEQDA